MRADTMLPQADHCLYVIDDDPSVRKALQRLLALNNFTVKLFASAEEFLTGHLPRDLAGCLLVDIRMDGMTGLELQQTLLKKRITLPIIFITGYGTVAMSVQALKHGAFNFIEKPFDAKDLLICVNDALTKSRRLLAESRRHQELARKFNNLTSREKEVLEGLVRGRLNKVIAADLGIVEKTVKVHRASLMAKMAVDSLAELLQMYSRYQILTEQEEGPDTHTYQHL
jgi:FixJ family two-component response regulator